MGFLVGRVRTVVHFFRSIELTRTTRLSLDQLVTESDMMRCYQNIELKFAVLWIKVHNNNKKSQLLKLYDFLQFLKEVLAMFTYNI